MNNAKVSNLDEKNCYDSSQLLAYIKKLELEKFQADEKIKNLEREFVNIQKKLNISESEKNKACKMRDHMFEAFEHSQEKLISETILRDNTISSLKNELKTLLAKNSKLNSTVCHLQLKSDRCDELEYNLSNAQKKINMQLTEFDENIKSNVMDAMYVIEEIDSYVNKFKKDINKTRNDIKIGTRTIEDIIIILEKEVDLCNDKLNKIRDTFLKNNNIFDAIK